MKTEFETEKEIDNAISVLSHESQFIYFLVCKEISRQHDNELNTEPKRCIDVKTFAPFWFYPPQPRNKYELDIERYKMKLSSYISLSKYEKDNRYV